MKNLQRQIDWILKEKYGGKETEKIKRDIKRLKIGEPIDYIIGFTDFLGCKVDLSKRPLIPRVETEFWVDKVIKELKNRKPFDAAQAIQALKSHSGSMRQNLRILDIFAGSGCIGIAVLKHMPNANVVFAEKNKKFLEQIKINLKINPPQPIRQKANGVGASKISKRRYKIIQSDVFSNVKGKFDYIFANPPYIADYRNNPSVRLRTILRNRIQKSVLRYEPKEAYLSKEKGLYHIRKFLTETKNFLNRKGKIYMEFDYVQKNEIEKILKKYGYKEFEFHRDQYGKWRWLVVKSIQ